MIPFFSSRRNEASVKGIAFSKGIANALLIMNSFD